MTSEPIRIILSDDHQLVRDSWKTLLENNAGFKVVATCNNTENALVLARELQPDIVLVDINMASPLTGLGVAENLVRNSTAKVVGLSVSNHPKYAIRMLEIGAMGFLTKTSTLDEVYRGIEAVVKGQNFISSEVKARMTEQELSRFP